MKILFITSNRLGDAVLSTGILQYLMTEHPDAEVTVACGPLGESLFASAPNVKEVKVLRKKSYARHWLYLWQECRKTKWDIIVDIRDSIVSRILSSNQTFIWSGGDTSLHKVEQMASVLKLETPPSPHLWFSDAQMGIARDYIPDGTGAVLAIGPAANWMGKTWAADRFSELIARLTGSKGILPDAPVAVFAAPGEEEIAEEVLFSIPKKRRIDVIAQLNPGDAAAVLSRCALYIGNDSGLMHCAVATNIPTVGLFGPGYPEHYRPWGAHTTYVQTPETADELLAPFGGDASKVTESLMDSLTVDAVEEAVIEHWQTCAKKKAG